MQRERPTSGQHIAKTPMTARGQRIGLMGGTFNPPHQGHLRVSYTALRRLNLDKLWWIVTPGNPLKKKTGLPPSADRVAACRKLIRNPRIEVTDFESYLKSPYTTDTVAFLKRRHPGVRFVWIMGADGLASFDHWKFWHCIFQMVPIAVIDRPGWRYKSLASMAPKFFAQFRLPEDQSKCLPLLQPPAWTYLTAPLSAQSSTALRSAKTTKRH